MPLFLRRNRSETIEDLQLESPVRVAVIGLGAMGQRNLEHLKGSRNFRLVGVHDLRRSITEKTARKFRSKSYDSIDACVSDPDIEAIFVCTPHHLLASVGLRALRSDKHLLIEKPMAIDTKSADELIELGIERELVVSVNYSRIFSGSVSSARRLIALGAVGDLIGIETRWNGYKPPGYYHGVHSPSPDDWRLDRNRAGGGMVMMTTCHALHFVPYITGAKVTSAAAVFTRSAVAGDVEDTLQGVMQVDGGATWAVLTSSSQRGIGVNDTTIWGSSGTVVLQPDQIKYYSTRVIEGKRPGAWHEVKQHRYVNYFGRWLDDTAGAIRRRKDLEASPQRAWGTLAVIEALYQSASSGSVVQVG